MEATCTFELLPWKRATIQAEEGNANALFLVGWSEERAQWLNFSHPLIETEYGFFVHKDNSLVYSDPGNLKGYHVGVYGPSKTSTSLEKLSQKTPDLTIDMTPDDESAFKKLSGGRVNAVYSNKDVGLAMIIKLKLDNIRYAGKDKPLKYYIGFVKKSTDVKLVERFNNAYKKLLYQNVISEILKKHSLTLAKLE